MNEVFFPRSMVMKMPAKDKKYIFDEINCSIVCEGFHTQWGHGRKFREWFEYIQRRRYGDYVVDEYLKKAPFKSIMNTHTPGKHNK